jgi:hypothetical protein
MIDLNVIQINSRSRAFIYFLFSDLCIPPYPDLDLRDLDLDRLPRDLDLDCLPRDLERLRDRDLDRLPRDLERLREGIDLVLKL